jgi:hypothetical protein
MPMFGKKKKEEGDEGAEQQEAGAGADAGADAAADGKE